MKEQLKNQILHLPVRRIRDLRPRQATDPEELRDLTDSVALYGVLQPLSVRAEDGYWVLLDGDKRLRAAKLAGMETVPCLVADTLSEELLQKLRRRNLGYLTQARLLQQLMQRQGLNQLQTARLLGMTQGALANSLRILKHPPHVLQALQESGLSQRHARALLAAPEERRCSLIRQAEEEGWTVSRLEKQVAEERPGCSRRETDTEVILTIRLPKAVM